MSSISINGSKYLPDNFKKVDLEGKDVETFLKENQDKIKSNFRDEIYVAKDNDLYVAEFKNFPQSDLKKEKIQFIEIPGSEIKLIDEEVDKHPIAKVAINGVKDKELEKFIKETFDVKTGSKVSIDDILGKLKELQEKGKDKYLNIDIVPTPAKGSKNGEVELAINVIEKPKAVSFSGVSPEDAKKLQEIFKGDLTKDNIQAGINKLKASFDNHPEKMLAPKLELKTGPNGEISRQVIPPIVWTIDDKGTLNFSLNTVDLGKKEDVFIAVPSKEGRIGIGNIITNAEEHAFVSKAFKLPLTSESVDDGIKTINAFYRSKGIELINPQVTVNKEGMPEISVVKLEKDELSKEDNDLIAKAFKKPLNQENVAAGMKTLNEHFGAKGMMLVNPQIELNKDGELDITVIKVKAPRKIAVTGMEVFDADDIKKNFKMPLNTENIDAGVEAIKKKYKEAGYVLTGPAEGVQVDTNGDELRVNISLAKFDGFDLFGNADSKDKTVTRELGNIKEGKPLNLMEVEKGMDRIRKTGLFKDATYTLNMKEDGKVRLNLIVQEQKNNEFSIFGGYSAGGGIFGGGGVTFGNLGGSGRTLAIKGEAGTKRLGGSISYTDPWLTDKKVGFGTSLYAYKWEGPNATEFRVGNNTNFSIPLGKDYLDTKWTLTPGLRSEYIGIAKEYSSSGTGNDYLIMPKIGINYMDVDNPNNPKQGTKGGVTFGIGTGSATFGQLDGNIKHYIPLTNDKKLTLALGANAGGQVGNVPYYEMYNSFNTAPVYGRASDGNERGNFYGVGSANLKYNVWGPFSIVAGTTVGGIGQNITDLGAGGGIEVDLMGIPLSVTAGARYNPVTKEKDTAINFNIFKVDW
jgi:outer membrane protein assembly factor BamA